MNITQRQVALMPENKKKAEELRQRKILTNRIIELQKQIFKLLLKEKTVKDKNEILKKENQTMKRQIQQELYRISKKK